MVIKNNSGNIRVDQSIAPDVRANISINGTSVDLQGVDASFVAVSIGNYTDGVHTLKVQHSDDNISFVDVPSEDLDGAMVVADSTVLENKILKIGYLGTKRYLRVSLNVTGATSGAATAAYVVGSLLHHSPV